MHKFEVYIRVRQAFGQAWAEFHRGRGTSAVPPWQPYLSVHEEELADEVARHAHIPSYGSARAVRDMARRPWQVPHYTRDDGVESMTPGEVRRICLDWLAKNYR